jgi:hypothetical protein
MQGNTAFWKELCGNFPFHGVACLDYRQSTQFLEQFQRNLLHNAEFFNRILWSDEASFKLNNTVNCQNCPYWPPAYPHNQEDTTKNLPELTVWFGVSCRIFIGPFFFEGKVSSVPYLEILRISTVPAIYQLYENEVFHYQQDGASHITTEVTGATLIKFFQSDGQYEKG